jgi:hypothetical protein
MAIDDVTAVERSGRVAIETSTLLAFGAETVTTGCLFWRLTEVTAGGSATAAGGNKGSFGYAYGGIAPPLHALKMLSGGVRLRR